MSPRFLGAVLAGCALFAANAQAEVAVTADLGTTGPGVHFVDPLTTWIKVF